MPIRIHLDRLLEARGMTVEELVRQTGVPRANLHRLKSGQVRALRITVLETLCRVLACTPADLLEYVPASPADRAEPPLPVDAHQQAVLEVLGRGPMHPDDVAAATGLKAQQVSVALLALELADLARKTGPLYRRC